MTPGTSCAIVGAGPAGLTAAYLLAKAGARVTVLEADPRDVGGISRTATYKGYRFDIGGHRFFSRWREVEDLWTEILPDGMLERRRSSRIFYCGKFFAYPLRGLEALRKLGLLEAARCMLSYLRARAFPHPRPRSFEHWVSNEFGRRLYEIFFRTYTEKVWGMPCAEISADWAAERIQGLSLGKAIIEAIRPRRSDARGGGDVLRTALETFRYPRRGPGMLWEACAAKVRALGGEVRLGRRVVRVRHDRGRGATTVEHVAADGHGPVERLDSGHVISSAPLPDLVRGLDPAVSGACRAAADALRHRDFLVVALILRDRGAFADQWIYIHDPAVRVGRIQNFKAWSPEMVPDAGMTCYGLEYFCFEDDGLWSAPDAELIERAKRELEAIGLAPAGDVVDGTVVRQRKAYPVYDDGYAENVERVRAELAETFPSVHLVGRNGMHRYDNQDHAMMSAMLTVKNILAGRRAFDPWKDARDGAYLEATAAAASSATGVRRVPRRLRAGGPPR